MSQYRLTKEQQNIVDAAVQSVSQPVNPRGALKALAAAGSGKTSTLIEIGKAIKERYPNAKILYLAYNREIRTEAEAKFGRLAESYTMHGLAHHELNLRKINRRFGYVSNGHVRDILGKHISDGDIKLLKAGLKMFTESPDYWPSEKHFPAMLSRIPISEDKKTALKKPLVEFFMALTPENRKTSLPIPHDVYLKYWHMVGSPGLDRYDLVMLDEAQDANPVILSALEGAGRSIYVGDSHQAIYQWRNAVDALQNVYGQAFPMTQSFRFGPAIADVANKILSYKHDQPEHLLRGFERMTTMLGPVDRKTRHTRIFRTNRALIREALLLYDRSIPFAITGNNDEMANMIESLWALKEGNGLVIHHPLIRSLKTWGNALRSVEQGNDNRDLNQAFSVLGEFAGRVPDVTRLLKHSRDEKKARVILTTAHRSKGCEWENVIIAPDFDAVIENARKSKQLWDPEMNLLYVAATRAMGRLEVRCEWLRKLMGEI